jgi:hypothetical protein
MDSRFCLASRIDLSSTRGPLVRLQGSSLSRTLDTYGTLSLDAPHSSIIRHSFHQIGEMLDMSDDHGAPQDDIFWGS